MLQTIKELVSIPSVTDGKSDGDMPFGKEVYKALKYVLGLCDSFGFRTKNCGNYLGWAEIGQGDELMGILCHLDVVPPGSDWDYDPFDCTLVDGKVYGRGVMDDKGPAVAAIYAMKDILDSGKQLNKRVRIIFGCQEETGDWIDMDYYKDHEEIPTFGFTPDADFPTIYGEKGILMVQLSMNKTDAGFVHIKGGEAPNMVPDSAVATVVDNHGKELSLSAKGSAAHGSTPEDGENAISKLMESISKTHAKCKFADFYNKLIGFSLNGDKMGCNLVDEASGPLSFNVGMIGMDESSAFIKVDIRFPVTMKKENVIELIENKVKDWGIRVSEITSMKPVYMDKNGPVISKLMEAYKEVTNDDAVPQVMGGGTYARAMDNIVAFGPVFPGRECTEHQKNEYIYLDDLEKAREIYKVAIEKLATERKVQVNGVYRHFKGRYYIVTDMANHSETQEQYVVYRQLYGEGSLWIRPLEMFLSEVDRNKYPDSQQKYRFELQKV